MSCTVDQDDTLVTNTILQGRPYRSYIACSNWRKYPCANDIHPYIVWQGNDKYQMQSQNDHECNAYSATCQWACIRVRYPPLISSSFEGLPWNSQIEGSLGIVRDRQGSLGIVRDSQGSLGIVKDSSGLLGIVRYPATRPARKWPSPTCPIRPIRTKYVRNTYEIRAKYARNTYNCGMYTMGTSFQAINHTYQRAVISISAKLHVSLVHAQYHSSKPLHSPTK